jgi:D-alanine-D-alanine ligase
VRVVVLSGGRSSEHEISLASGAAVREGLAQGGHEVIGVEIGRDGTWGLDGDEVELLPGRGLLGADVVFPVLHGPFGEDGTVQGLLECLDVAYVGAGVLASAVCMDKVVFKELMARADLPQVAYRGVEHRHWREDPERVLAELAELGLPVFVKPARLGSSVGIVRVAEMDELAAAVEQALSHDERAIVEAAAGGIEVECSVIGHTGSPEASVPGEIVVAGRDWYDYEAKYTPGGMELIVPARVSETARERVREVAIRAFTLSGCEGLARVDFFVDGEDVVLNELNTIPGFTETSVFGKLFEASGLPYAELLDRLARLGAERHAAERAYRH